MPGTLYPPGAPTVSGNLISVEQFLKNPERVRRVITDLTLQRFIADRIFSVGGAAGGAVIYDQVTTTELFTSRDVQGIAPGAEFPVVDAGENTPKAAAVTKWGGAAIITYEAVRRDDRDVLNRQLTKLRNTIVRKVDTVAIAALDAALAAAAPSHIIAGTSWSNAGTGNPINDLAVGRSAIDDADMGYTADTVLINPAQMVSLIGRADVRASLPRENVAANPITSGQLNGFMGYREWYVTNRVAAGTAYILAAKVAGSIRDELGLYSRVIDQEENERYLVQAARVTVPVITDPFAVYKLTGLT